MSGYSHHGAEVVAYVSASVIEGFTPALAQALRDGVPVERLDGLASWANSRRVVVTDSAANQQRMVGVRIAHLKRAIANYERQVERADTPELGDPWAIMAADARVELNERQGELAELDQKPQRKVIPDEFESEVGFLLTAARALSNHKGPMPREMVHQIATVIPERSIRVLPDSRLQVEVYARLPMDGGVARVGPIAWIPDDQPDLSIALMWASREEAGEPAPWLAQPAPPKNPLPRQPTTSRTAPHRYRGERTRRRGERPVIIQQLVEAGATQSKALTLVACPFPAAVPVVLAQAAGEPAPDWVGAQWADPTWMAWLHATYLKTGRSISHGGRWAIPAWTRQLLIDTVEDGGGRMNYLTLAHRVVENGVSATALNRLLRLDGPPPQNGQRPWPAPFERWGLWPYRGQASPADQFGVNLKTCGRCDEQVVVATRVEEIVGDALCPNGHMFAATSSLKQMFGDQTHSIPDPMTVVVPDEYQWMRAPSATYQWRRPTNAGSIEAMRLELERETRIRSRFLSPTQLTEQQREAVVSRYADDGLTAAQVASEFGMAPGSLTRMLREAGVMRPYRNRERAQQTRASNK